MHEQPKVVSECKLVCIPDEHEMLVKAGWDEVPLRAEQERKDDTNSEPEEVTSSEEEMKEEKQEEMKEAMVEEEEGEEIEEEEEEEMEDEIEDEVKDEREGIEEKEEIKDEKKEEKEEIEEEIEDEVKDEKEEGIEEKEEIKDEKKEEKEEIEDEVKDEKKEEKEDEKEEGIEGEVKEEEEEVEIVEEKFRPKIKPVLDPEVRAMLDRKKERRLPAFKRQEWFRYKRLGDHWRRPKGLHSKMRTHKGYRPPVVRVGYRTPSKVRGLHPSGFKEVLVRNPSDLDGLDPEKEAVRIGHTVGLRKRIDIVEKADSLNIRVLNRRGL